MWRFYSTMRHRFLQRPLPTLLILAASVYLVIFCVKQLSQKPQELITEEQAEGGNRRSPDYDEAGHPMNVKNLQSVSLSSECAALQEEMRTGWSEFIERMNARQESFQAVAQGVLLYVHTAYSDFRQLGKMRIIGLRQMATSKSLQCQLWYAVPSGWQVVADSAVENKGAGDAKADAKSETVLVRMGGEVQISNIPEGHSTSYVAAYFECTNNFETIQDQAGNKKVLEPFAVSVVPSGECGTPHNLLFVRSTKPLYEAAEATESADDRANSKQHKFAVCVTPLNLAFNKVDQLIEMLELNRVLGASHVVFYNNTLGKDAARVLAEYVKEGYVSLVQWQPPCRVHVWPVPPGYQEEVHYFAQLGSLNDCLMRTMSRFKYAVFTDMDEFAVPRTHANWFEMRDDYFAKNMAAAYTFRNTFFKLEWADDSEIAKNETVVKYRLNTILKLKREETINMPGSRSKLIVDPTMIDTIGIHQIWLFHPRAHVLGGMSHVMPVEIGMIHHYRNWETVGTDGQHDDRYMLKFSDQLITNVLKSRKRLDKLGVYKDNSTSSAQIAG